MLPIHSKVKGIHPGIILKRELSKRKIKAIELSKEIDEHPQTINAITKEKRGVNAKLSIKLGEYFNVERDYFMLLQASFEVSNKIIKSNNNPLVGKIRKSIFWDTEFSKIDIDKHKRSIIKRILERGNSNEVNELIKIYGTSEIKKQSAFINGNLLTNYRSNLNNYILNSKDVN